MICRTFKGKGIGSWDWFKQVPTVMVTFVHIRNFSIVSYPILTNLLDPIFGGLNFCGTKVFELSFFYQNIFMTKQFFGLEFFTQNVLDEFFLAPTYFWTNFLAHIFFLFLISFFINLFDQKSILPKKGLRLYNI